MKFHKNKLITTVAAAALVLAVGACSSSSDDDETSSMMTSTTPTTPTTPTEPTTPAPLSAAETLAAAQADYDGLTNESTDEERAVALMALEAALMLEGNEAEYIVYLEKLIADQEAAAATLAAAADTKKASDMAKAVHAAIGVNTGQDVTPDADPAEVKLAASSAGELTATLAGYMMTGAAPEPITGWKSATLDKDGDTTVIYTNIENEVPTALDDIYARASGLPKAAQTYSVTTTGAESTINWVDAKRDDSAEQVDRSGEDPVTTFAGSVRGVAGTFSCTDACMAPTVTDGALTGANGTWAFAPTDPGAMINVKDEAYVSFGWWLNAMGTAGAYEFDAFASVVGMEFNTGQGSALEGSATYKGGAAGKYAMQSTTDDSASGGHFTASATLTANFDASTDPVTINEDGVSIGGTITDFMTGAVSRPNWKVTLTTPDTTVVGPITGVDATTVWATGGAVDGKGTWSANFYGEDDDDHPTAATGEFNAGIGGGDIARISGAFAATKQ